MSNYTNEEIQIISIALKDNSDTLNIFLNGINSSVKNKEY